jgi:hypothetical protein
MAWSVGAIFTIAEDAAIAIPVMIAMLYWCCHGMISDRRFKFITILFAQMKAHRS